MDVSNLMYYSEELGMVFKIDANEKLYVTHTQPTGNESLTVTLEPDYHFEPVDFYDLRDYGDDEMVTIIEDIHFGLIIAKRTFD